MHTSLLAALWLALTAGIAITAQAEVTRVGIGISDWTGDGALTLAKKAGIFERNGLDVDLRKIAQNDRPLAFASGDIQCAVTTVESWIVWNASGVPTKQILQVDTSHGADGIVVRNNINSFKDLSGKKVATSAPGTTPYFALAWMLDKNGMTVGDVSIVSLEPGPGTEAFLAGQNEAVVTYEPYLSAVRAKPEVGKILATTLDYPMLMDTLGCTPKFLEERPQAAKAIVESYYQALDMIRAQPEKSYEEMGADVNQTAQEFAESAKYLRWADREQNKKFFSGEVQEFQKQASELLMRASIIKRLPDTRTIIDTRFIQN